MWQCLLADPPSNTSKLAFQLPTQECCVGWHFSNQRLLSIPLTIRPLPDVQATGVGKTQTKFSFGQVGEVVSDETAGLKGEAGSEWVNTGVCGVPHAVRAGSV